MKTTNKLRLKLFKRLLIYISKSRKQMTGTIFSNLPNNLIMNIIKMAEDQRKKEEKEDHQKKFIDVMNQFNKVEEDMLSIYSREERDSYESENYIGTDQRKPEGCFILGDLFWQITRMNHLLEVKYYDDDAPREWDYDWHLGVIEPSWAYDINALQQEMEYNHPPEDAYDWGDDDEPSWAYD